MPKCRKQRNEPRRWQRKARQFAAEAAKAGKKPAGSGKKRGKGGYLLELHNQRLTVSGGRRRLVQKQHHVGYALRLQEMLFSFLKKTGKKPEHYALVKAKADPNLVVQEFFKKPSFQALEEFLKARAAKQKKARLGGKEMGRDEAMICKQFANQPQNKGVSLQKLRQAWNEFKGHYSEATGHEMLKGENVLVLGQNRDGRLRLAMVDW